MINVLADQYLYNIQSYLPESINLQLFDPARGLPSDLEKAHAMLIRTVIPINKQTLPNIPKELQFIGTGSSGTDHVDVSYLNENDIYFADAAGCNARSVAEYIATALLMWSEKRDKNLKNLSIGIIGVGNVGTEVIQILKGLGLQILPYDPPRSKREPNFKSASIDKVLQSDILSFHTPLTRKVPYPTFHWLDKQKLSDNSFHLILNSARGGIIDEKALLRAMKQGKVRDIIIDTWEDEPEIHLDTAGAAFIKTPHIAGYSVQAKQNASKFIADELINYFNLNKPANNNQNEGLIFDKNIAQFNSLSELLTELHPIKKYEEELARIIKRQPQKRGALFNKLRAEHPLRLQFNQIRLPTSYFEQYPILKKLGFSGIS